MADILHSRASMIQRFVQYYASFDVSLADREFIRRRGFEIRQEPMRDLKKPYFVMSDARFEFHSGYDGRRACAVSARFFDPENDTYLLANQAVAILLAEKGDFGKGFGKGVDEQKFYYDSPEGQPFVVFVENEAWLPVAEELLKMYGNQERSPSS